jgi:hypothetical protein
MLVEAQLAARAQDAAQLSKRTRLVGDSAEHQRGYGGVEARVGKRQPIGDRVDHGHRYRCACCGTACPLAQVVFGLDRHDFAHGGRLVREVQPVSGPELEYSSAHVGE